MSGWRRVSLIGRRGFCEHLFTGPDGGRICGLTYFRVRAPTSLG
jgi:hypothetical protein